MPGGTRRRLGAITKATRREGRVGPQSANEPTTTCNATGSSTPKIDHRMNTFVVYYPLVGKRAFTLAFCVDTAAWNVYMLVWYMCIANHSDTTYRQTDCSYYTVTLQVSTWPGIGSSEVANRESTDLGSPKKVGI